MRSLDECRHRTSVEQIIEDRVARFIGDRHASPSRSSSCRGC
jgi:hypothetical protein